MAEEKKTTEKTEEKAKAEPKPKKTKSDAKNAEIKKLTAQLLESKDMLLRTAAEFDNYKKRTEREKLSVAEYAKAGFAKELLPVIDNAKRAMAAESGTADYTKGLEMIVKQVLSLTDKLSLEELAAEGDVFDPNYHEAVMHVDDETLGENVITEVLQQGYKLGDTVIRPAMVKVAN